MSGEDRKWESEEGKKRGDMIKVNLNGGSENAGFQ